MTDDPIIQIGAPVSIAVRDAGGKNYACTEQRVALVSLDGTVIAQSLSIVDSRLAKLDPGCVAREAEVQVKYLTGMVR